MHISIEVPVHIADFILLLESEIERTLSSEGEKYNNGLVQQVVKQRDVVSLELDEPIDEFPIGLKCDDMDNNLVLIRRNRLGGAIKRFSELLRTSRRLHLNEFDAKCYDKLIEHYVKYFQDSLYSS